MFEALWTGFIDRCYRPTRWYLSEMVRQFLAHDCLSRAGALTYTTLFAVVPMMTVAYAMFSLLPEFENVGERIQSYVFQNFVPDSSAVVQEKLVEFSERARGLTMAGFVVLFVTAFMMLVTIEQTFNVIWNVAEPRRGMQRFLVYWGVLSLGPPFIAAGLLISLYLVSLPFVSEIDTFGLREALLGYLPATLTAAGFTVLYSAVPNCKVPFRNALVGGILTTAAFEAAKNLFTGVVANSNIEPIYGTFAAIPLFLIWLYLVWVIILSGAILVRTLSLTREDKAHTREPLVVKCARVLQLLYDAHMDGRGIDDDEISQHVFMTRVEHDRVFNALQAMNVLGQSEDGLWMLARNLKSLTLWDLYQLLPDGLELSQLEKVTGLDNVVEPLKALVQFGSNQMSISLDTVFGGAR